MCWNIESSVISAVYGYFVSLYLYKRKYSIRDPWYAVFLATFTTTQVFDAFFWWLAGDGDEIPCTEVNWYVSKYIIPPVIFFQPIVVSNYPSTLWPCLRWPYRIVTGLAMLLPIIYCGCTTLWQTTGGLLEGLNVIMYGGVMPPFLVMMAGIALWSVGVVLFITPWWVGTHILAVGGFNLLLLIVFDGTIQLVSKLCFYCLLLSVMWLLEPLYEPSLSKAQQSQQPQQQPYLPLQQQEEVHVVSFVDAETGATLTVVPLKNVV